MVLYVYCTCFSLNVETQVIRVPAGLQDYYPALHGGVNAVRFGPGGVSVDRLTTDPDDLERRIVLAYTGVPHFSGTNNWEIFKGHVDGSAEIFERFERIRDTTHRMREAIAAADFDEAGRVLGEEWENRRALSPGVSTPIIDELMTVARSAGAPYAKVCGAGGGGCLFCYGPPTARGAIAEALARGGARLLEYRIEMEGLRLG